MSTNLSGTLDLAGTLVLREKVLVGGEEALVVLPAGGSPRHGIGVSVENPPFPNPPVSIISSDNQSVTTGGRAIVTGGTVEQYEKTVHQGTVKPSTKNRGVRIGGTAICVVGDEGDIEGLASVIFMTSGQG
jgi:hypothetical protein